MRIQSLIKYCTNKDFRFKTNAYFGLYNNMNDEDFLKKMYHAKLGGELNLKNPKFYNEKMQWLKLNDRKELYTRMVDKYEAKKVVTDMIGAEYVIPLIGSWESFDEIDFSSFPDQFVLKTTHGCSAMVICRDKSKFDPIAAKNKLYKKFKVNYYQYYREWPYKNVKPRIIAEQYVQDGNTQNLAVYKILNFDGIPRIIQTIQNDKTPNESIDYFDTEWNLLDLKQNYPNSQVPLKKPETLEKMLELSRKCSQGFPFLRTDWYEVNGKVYFSEFTFYSDAGFEKFYPEKWDEIWGNWITLPLLERQK